MATKLYVGSLPYSVDDAKLKSMFDEFGDVVSAKVIVDRDTNQSKGFGFVELAEAGAATEAIKKLNGQDMDGRALVVNEARPQEDRSKSFGGGGGSRY